ncbi:S8 family serine peptidase [Myroides guanonis]|uniref:Por secretion system C-terminal sorting domain-containing protein n=1 Tax=Myroides guanonis TaxID=1150112 RepID=A0A1I3MDK3_9FLAO|nr:S8 family serine peptidase [Myroides guanonis]SFI94870.1 Por secretion system C-terminal sorting domain-containing protein [Myroides guanonis]
MEKRKIFKSVLAVFFLVYSLNGVAQNLDVRNRIQSSYELKDVADLKIKYKSNKDFRFKSKLPHDSVDLMEVDSLGVALYYKSYNQVSARVSNVIDESGNNVMGFSGKGMIVGLWDSKLPRLDHLDLKGSIRVTDDSDWLSYSNHATHVAGTIVSRGGVNPKGRGLVYQSTIWANDWTNDFEEMVDLASKGILVSNHSYGVDPKNIPVTYFGAYLSSSQRLDAIASRFLFYQPVVAAGNDREQFGKYNPTKEGMDLLLGMTTAKNAIVVAAVEGDDIDNLKMSSFSNWGPTDDLRIKPDIATRGVRVFSTLDENTTDYGFLSGTSMAAPVVSSVITIWQEAAIAFSGKPLWSSSMRALMVHSALSINQVNEPDYKTGWGLINNKEGLEILRSSVDEDGVRLIETDIKQGEKHKYKLKASGDSFEVKVTLSWTDPEGKVKFGSLDDVTPDLVNDLDLRLIDVKGNIYYPWMLKRQDGRIIAVQGDNTVDNLEQITVVNAIDLNELVLEVSYKSKIYRGVQSYSLLVSGIDDFEEVIDDENTIKKEGITVWPNPTQDFLVLSGIDVNTPFELEVLTVLGKRVKSINSYFQNDNIILDVNELSEGLYVVRIRSVLVFKDVVFIKKS